MAAALADPAFTEPRRKLHLLEADLLRLGVSPGDLAALPLFLARPYATAAEALGSMYVLEGATLGGQLIARRVAATLGFTPAYHGSYGAEVGAMWRGFRQRLAAIPPEQADLTVAAAATAFDEVREWLTARPAEVQVRSPMAISDRAPRVA